MGEINRGLGPTLDRDDQDYVLDLDIVRADTVSNFPCLEKGRSTTMPVNSIILSPSD